jgi:hypothetical protein
MVGMSGQFDFWNECRWKAVLRCKPLQCIFHPASIFNEQRGINPKARGRKWPGECHAGQDKPQSPSQIGPLCMVDGNSDLQNPFVEVAYLSWLISPKIFKGFMAFEVFTGVELLYGSEKLRQWLTLAIVAHPQ